MTCHKQENASVWNLTPTLTSSMIGMEANIYQRVCLHVLVLIFFFFVATK